MATLSLDGETHGELVVKVRRWLASVEEVTGGSAVVRQILKSLRR